MSAIVGEFFTSYQDIAPTNMARIRQSTFLPETLPAIDRFANLFQRRLSGKCITNEYLIIPPNVKVKCVATLPCEMLVPEN